MVDHILANFDELLEAFDDMDRSRVLSCLQPQTFRARQRIFDLGETSPNFMVIRTGRVRTFAITADGQQLTTGIWGPGYMLGLISCLAGSHRILSCEGIDQVSVDVLSAKNMNLLFAEIPEFALGIARLVAKSAAISITRTTIFASAPVQDRLIETLLTLGLLPDARTGPDSAVIKGLSQEDIASMVVASRPWISQSIRELEAGGFLESRRMEIKIPSLQALARLVN
jgi:CRP-like cAMP-binding protein